MKAKPVMEGANKQIWRIFSGEGKSYGIRYTLRGNGGRRRGREGEPDEH